MDTNAKLEEPLTVSISLITILPCEDESYSVMVMRRTKMHTIRKMASDNAKAACNFAACTEVEREESGIAIIVRGK